MKGLQKKIGIFVIACICAVFLLPYTVSAAEKKVTVKKVADIESAITKQKATKVILKTDEIEWDLEHQIGKYYDKVELIIDSPKLNVIVSREFKNVTVKRAASLYAVNTTAVISKGGEVGNIYFSSFWNDSLTIQSGAKVKNVTFKGDNTKLTIRKKASCGDVYVYGKGISMNVDQKAKLGTVTVLSGKDTSITVKKKVNIGCINLYGYIEYDSVGNIVEWPFAKTKINTDTDLQVWIYQDKADLVLSGKAKNVQINVTDFSRDDRAEYVNTVTTSVPVTLVTGQMTKLVLKEGAGGSNVAKIVEQVEVTVVNSSGVEITNSIATDEMICKNIIETQFSDKYIWTKDMGFKLPVLKRFNNYALSSDDGYFQTGEDNDLFSWIVRDFEDTTGVGTDNSPGNGFTASEMGVEWAYASYSTVNNLSMFLKNGYYELHINSALDEDINRLAAGRDYAPISRDIVLAMCTWMSSTPQEIYDYIYDGIYGDTPLYYEKDVKVGDAILQLADGSYRYYDKEDGMWWTHVVFRIRENESYKYPAVKEKVTYKHPYSEVIEKEDLAYYYDLVTGEATITRIYASSEEVVIPSEVDGHVVTRIGSGEEAFKYDEEYGYAVVDYGVKSVVIPDTVTEIGNRAFEWTSDMTSIVLSKNLKKIGVRAFMGSGLKSITIPASVEQLGKAFYPHTGMRVGTYYFGEQFRDCTELKEVVFEKGSKLEAIGERMFYECSNLETVVLSDTLKEIRLRAFYGCNLSSVKLPKNCRKVYDGAFQGNVNMKEIDLGKLTWAGENAFSGIGITELTVPNTLKYDDYAFNDLNNLKKITTGTGALRLVGAPKLKEITLSNGIKQLPDLSDASLKELTIPASVKYIGVCYWPQNIKKVTFLGDLDSEAAVRDAFTGSSNYNNIVIHCKKGTQIEKYCKNNKREYKIIK